MHFGAGSILQVDEGTFTAFAPKLLQQQLEEVKELVVPAPAPSLRGLDGGAVLKLVAAVVSLAVAIPILVVPQSQILAEAGDALCGEQPAPSHTGACLHADIDDFEM